MGVITRAFLDVFRSLLWGFHNAERGRCDPSYKGIAEDAGCRTSTVAEAIKALEACGLLTWDGRHERRRVPSPWPLRGWRTRVLTTSNAYRFFDPGPDPGEPKPTESDSRTGTAIQGSDSSLAPPVFDEKTVMNATLRGQCPAFSA